MLLFLIINSIYYQDISSFTINLGKHKKATLFSSNQNKRSSFYQKIHGFQDEKSNEGNWYYVHFLLNNLSNIQKILKIDRKNEISKMTFCLFLNNKEIELISNFSLIKKIDPKLKISEDIKKMVNDNKFIVITKENYNLENKLNDCNIKKINSNIFLIQFNNDTRLNKENKDFEYYKNKIIQKISNMPEIISIEKMPDMELNNAIISGFTQKNSDNFIQHPNLLNYYLKRYLNNHGLSGENQIVTVTDSPIDFNHAMFNDDDVPVQLNTYMPNHRKIVYYGFNGDFDDVKNGEINDEYFHGTHVAGTVAGKRLCNSDPLNMSIFNGNAPNAKIIYPGKFQDFGLGGFQDLMIKYNSFISTNSWGSNERSDGLSYIWDSIAENNPQLTFIFSAGNNYEKLNKNMSIGDPGTSKNIITVGALDSFYQYSERFTEITSLKNPDVKYTLMNVLIGKDPWINGTIGTDPEKSDIVVLNLTNENKCHLFNLNQTFLITDTIPEWIMPCVYSINPMTKLFIGDIDSLNSLLKIGGYDLISKPFQIKNKNWLNRANYSSTGPTYKGILKPDVMAPGTRIISAKASINSSKPYGCNENINNDLMLMNGTSMSTPNIGGAMALIHQFFNSGFWIDKVNIDGATSRALLINSCSHPLGFKTPDIFVGHGVVDLSTVLPVENDFGVQITHPEMAKELLKTHSISENGHVVAKILVNNSLINKKLQITLSYIDPMLNQESQIPITRDLDLIVVSPSKKTFYGDHLQSNDSQHSSTNEKVIIDENEIENGEYTVHIFGGVFADSKLSNSNDKQVFSVVASGPITNKYLEFNELSECLCGKCDPANPGYCLCEENKNIGPDCHVDIETVNGTKGEFTVGILEVKRVRFQIEKNIKSINSISSHPNDGFTLWISPKCHLSLGEYDIYDTTYNKVHKTKINFKTNEICIAIFNINDRSATYTIEVSDKNDINIGLIIGLVVASIVIVVIVVVVVICCIKRKNSKNQELNKSSSSKENQSSI